MEWFCGIAGAMITIGGGVHLVLNEMRLKSLFWQMSHTRNDLIHLIAVRYAVQPCFRCHEFTMIMLEFSPNGRSIHYQCLHCKKKTHSPAGTPDAHRAIDKDNALMDLFNAYNAKSGFFKRDITPLKEIIFDAPAVPLPYEQTTRTPIPESIRSEVWRRDSGSCVQCGSKQNLQFDHIIPVSRGGATSVVNLQLLCQPCNGKKTNTI
jgi:hypothetical protein